MEFEYSEILNRIDMKVSVHCKFATVSTSLHRNREKQECHGFFFFSLSSNHGSHVGLES